MADKEWDELRKRQREQQRREADERRQASLDAAAAEEAMLARFNSAEDKAFDDAFKDILGYSAKEVQEHVARAKDADVGRMLQDIQKAGKAGKNDKVKKLLKKNKGAIKAAAKEGKKKGSGCAVIALFLLGAASAVAYAVAQGVSAVAGALW